MTAKLLSLAGVGLLVASSSGCMTLVAQTLDSRVYGGLELAWHVEQRWRTSSSVADKFLLAGLYLDFPLTAVADTLLLPGTLPAQLLESRPGEIPENEPYVVVVKSRLLGWRWLWWPHHSWLEVKEGDESKWMTMNVGRVTTVDPSVFSIAPKWVRKDEWEGGRSSRLSAVAPTGSRVRVHAVITGERARQLLETLKELARGYKDRKLTYDAWPGPNSNTFVADMGREVPGLAFELDANACGKDYVRWVRAGVSTTGTGISIDTMPLGIQLGLVEGVELHFFQLTLGVSLFPPALKLPMLQRLGFPPLGSGA